MLYLRQMLHLPHPSPGPGLCSLLRCLARHGSGTLVGACLCWAQPWTAFPSVSCWTVAALAIWEKPREHISSCSEGKACGAGAGMSPPSSSSRTWKNPQRLPKLFCDKSCWNFVSRIVINYSVSWSFGKLIFYAFVSVSWEDIVAKCLRSSQGRPCPLSSTLPELPSFCLHQGR